MMRERRYEKEFYWCFRRGIRSADFRGVGTDTQVTGISSLITSRHK